MAFCVARQAGSAEVLTGQKLPSAHLACSLSLADVLVTLCPRGLGQPESPLPLGCPQPLQCCPWLCPCWLRARPLVCLRTRVGHLDFGVGPYGILQAALGQVYDPGLGEHGAGWNLESILSQILREVQRSAPLGLGILVMCLGTSWEGHRWNQCHG